MKLERFLLLTDAIINLALGVLLLFFPSYLVPAMGIPTEQPAFYPSILGAVLVGISLALLIERSGGGLGLRGAVSINFCGGIVLGLWLLLGDLQLPFRGFALLWGLVVILVGISTFEILAPRRGQDVG